MRITKRQIIHGVIEPEIVYPITSSELIQFQFLSKRASQWRAVLYACISFCCGGLIALFSLPSEEQDLLLLLVYISLSVTSLVVGIISLIIWLNQSSKQSGLVKNIMNRIPDDMHDAFETDIID